MLVQPQAAEEDEEVEIPTAPAQPSLTYASSPLPQDPIPTPPQAQPDTPSSQTQEQPTETSESSIPLLNTLLETCATLFQKVVELEQDKHTQALEIIKLKKRVKKLEKKKKKSRSSSLKMLRKVDTSPKVESFANTVVGGIDQDVSVAATKDVNAVEPTVFDDEEVTITMAQTLIKMKAKKVKILDEQIAKRLHDEEVEKLQPGKSKKKMIWKELKKYQSLKKKPVSISQARKNMIIYLKNMTGYKMEHLRGTTCEKVRPIFERGYKKLQTLFKPDKDVEEPIKKRVAEETLLQESFKKLKAVEVSVSEFKVEALQVKYPIIDWEIHYEGSRSYWKIIIVGGITEAYQSFEDMLKGFDIEDLVALLFEPDAEDVLWKLQRYIHYPITWKLYSNYGVHQVSSTTRRHDIFMLTEKNYPLSNGVITLMLSAKSQVKEDSDMVRDLVMKIFMEANKPKSRSLDTSSK
nr:hypothetical protein [Tanacetum cinerariifolium]